MNDRFPLWGEREKEGKSWDEASFAWLNYWTTTTTTTTLGKSILLQSGDLKGMDDNLIEVYCVWVCGWKVVGLCWEGEIWLMTPRKQNLLRIACLFFLRHRYISYSADSGKSRAEASAASDSLKQFPLFLHCTDTRLSLSIDSVWLAGWLRSLDSRFLPHSLSLLTSQPSSFN